MRTPSDVQSETSDMRGGFKTMRSMGSLRQSPTESVSEQGIGAKPA
ncbi:MAG: hypothetical protein GX096_06505 [Clostridiales bacterium]|nr:hypothetical protein [Clostridiales bacterium]